jgi:DNA-binding PadR family transcriptional regulator
MSISYAILGILSCKPLTGYDLKKIIQSSSFMPWSGNNNQIYKSLVELLEEGFVINEVQHQESSPTKKIYTITEEGLTKLKEWVLSSPDPLEFKKPFLVQLAWADQLSAEELNDLLARYEYEIKMQILSHQEKKRRGNFSPKRTPREKLIWDMIDENIVSSYENELEWVGQLHREICGQNEEDKI